MSQTNISSKIYVIYADRNRSQFNQKRQVMRCRILEAHRDHFLVESLKRYNSKYPESNRATTGRYAGMPVRRINKSQARVIVDEATGKWLTWDTVRRREGTTRSPGRARGGR